MTDIRNAVNATDPAGEARPMCTPFSIGGCAVKNRLVASAMFEYGADEGHISERIIERYRQLAEGGAGLIITGMHAVTAAASLGPIMVNAAYDSYEDDLARLAEVAHANGAKLFVQLQHCGGSTAHAEGYDHFYASPKTADDGTIYHEATAEELAGVARAFGEAAARCRRAGVDGVQVHAAHGFLINAFLSSTTNRRTDAYGGAIENRARLLFEVVEAIRTAAGPDYPLAVKFPFSDLRAGGTASEESLWVCEQLEQRGVDMIEVSSGMVMDGTAASFTPTLKRGAEPPFLQSAERVAARVRMPVVSVCGHRDPDVIDAALARGRVAAVSFGRPLVREPDLPRRWRRDRTPAACASCNRCCASFADGIITCHARGK